MVLAVPAPWNELPAALGQLMLFLLVLVQMSPPQREGPWTPNYGSSQLRGWAIPYSSSSQLGGEGAVLSDP